MKSRGWAFITSCIEAESGEAINAMKDAATEITRRTFLRYVDRDDHVTTERTLGYADHAARGLTMARDWHVSYHRGVFRGRPCVYFRWSGIEHIYQSREATR